MRLTQEVGRGIEAYRWSADGRRLIFDRDRRGDENWQLCSLELATLQVLELTPGPGGAGDGKNEGDGGGRDGDSGAETSAAASAGVNARYYGGSVARPGWIAVGLNDRDPRWHDVYPIELSSGGASCSGATSSGCSASCSIGSWCHGWRCAPSERGEPSCGWRAARRWRGGRSPRRTSW